MTEPGAAGPSGDSIGKTSRRPKTAPPPTNDLAPITRTFALDRQWPDESTLSGRDLQHHVFQRVSAKQVRFENVIFRYSTFESCYLRSCEFVSCDFTGCRFIGTNLNGSNFTDCRFEYALFEHTIVDSNVLDDSAPRHPNQRLWFARTLRANYQSLGYAEAVNKAILVELEATRIHLKRSWSSKDDYYRQKYKGLERFIAFLRWLGFTVGHYVWGNGERPLHLLRTIVALVAVLAIFDTVALRDPLSVVDWVAGTVDSAQAFLGTMQPNYPGPLLVLIALTRYVVLGLFVSVLVRRFARR